MPLPIDIGKAVVCDGRSNSACGLSGGHSHCGMVAIKLKKIVLQPNSILKKCEGN